MTANKFSYYQDGINNVIPNTEVSIEDIIKDISSLNLKLRIEKIRNISHDSEKVQKQLRNKLKRYLPYITVSGTFKKRANDQIVKQSGYAAIDIDGLKYNKELKTILKEDPYIVLLFESPSGNGLKAIIKIEKNIEEFVTRVKTYYNYLFETYHIKIDSLDKSTSEISRACYLTYDPNYYYNPKAKVFTNIDQKLNIDIGNKKDKSRSAIEYREIIKLLYLGKTKEQVYELISKEFEKWNEATEAYREHTFEKAAQYVAENKPATEVKDEIINKLTEDIVNNFHIYTIRSDKYPAMYIYKDGIYVENAKSYIYEYIEKCIGIYYSKNIADKVIEKIQPQTFINQEDLFEEENPEFVCVENGILNLFTGELMDFTPEKRFFNKLPVKYDPDKKAEHTKIHFETVLKPADQLLIQELYGFLLFKSYKYQKAFMFSGDGGNGKSVTLDQIKCFLGVENCANISLETLEKNNFIKGYLHKKMANLADDIGKAKLNETRTFKEMTGGGIITSDVKNMDPITFTNYAKQIFNANQIPIIDDESDGFWRRWIIIRFDMTFISKYQYAKKKKEGILHKNHQIADTSLIEKLTEPEELSGVLNWAIEGFKRLIEQDGFTYTKSLEDTRKFMRRYSSSVLAFCYDCLEEIQSYEQYEIIDELYKSYINYCFTRKKKKHPESEINFRKMLAEELPIEQKRKGSIREYRVMFTKFIGVPEDIM